MSGRMIWASKQARALVGEEMGRRFDPQSRTISRRRPRLPRTTSLSGRFSATASKTNPDPVVGTGVDPRGCADLTDKPIVAIGGITLETRGGRSSTAGADSVAVISDICARADRVRRAREQYLDLLGARESRRVGLRSRIMADTTSQTISEQPTRTHRNDRGFVRAIGLVRRHHDRRRVDDRLRHFYRRRGYHAPDRFAGGLLLTWIITGLLTIAAAFRTENWRRCFPHAGGQYIYLREAYSPLWGFLYGWTLFLVIQTGTIAAVAVGFARYFGVLFPSISAAALDHPADRAGLEIRHQSVGAATGRHPDGHFLTFLNTQGVRLGKLIQNIFTSAKTLSLLGLILAVRLSWPQRRRHLRQFRPFLGGSRRAADRARRGFSSRTRADGHRGDWSSDSSSRLAWRRSARYFPPMPGTTSASPPPK